jgi:hypothetical protein
MRAVVRKARAKLRAVFIGERGGEGFARNAVQEILRQ